MDEVSNTQVTEAMMSAMAQTDNAEHVVIIMDYGKTIKVFGNTSISIGNATLMLEIAKLSLLTSFVGGSDEDDEEDDDYIGGK